MAAKLKPWREVITPHPDVASGRYAQADFAADLAQVLQGAAEPEYGDPVEFYRRTYLTAGMKGLLRSALERLSGKGGDPVIQLKTAFGGGKTHTMLALYHLLRGDKRLARLDGVKEVLQEAGLKEPPKAAIAVLVGTYLDPTTGTPKPELGGGEVRTLWGEMAFQLGGVQGYRLVAEADGSGAAPGGRTLDQLFQLASPCVVLIDELVAYIRNIKGSRLPGGSFDSNMTFVQNLTESVKRNPRAVLVAAIPQSDIEVGGPAGLEVLHRVENTFGRVEAVWKPVDAQESFEVVRRRLFTELKDEEGRDAACSTFGRLYRDNRADFPVECREVDYERRMKASYPIHPEVFERLYDDWSSTERFQRTRGVLRLMATVIHQLWQAGDASPLIMPGSLPLHAPRVRDELMRYLNDQWNPVIDEADGDSSQSARIDNENQRFGQLQAARRVARTIFLGSVPYKSTKGIEETRIRLGVVQPEESISTYNDALGRLQQRSQYLYTSGQGRYWLDVQPNLTRTVADRSSKISDDEVFNHLEERLEAKRLGKGDFAGIYVNPAKADDVADEPSVRLVVLSPRHPHKRNAPDSKALAEAQAMLQSRGNSPRRCRNMLLFVAADEDAVQLLVDETRRYMAWRSVQKDTVSLNLDRAQEKQVDEAVNQGNKTVEVQLDALYQWALAPKQEGTGSVEWETLSLRGSSLGSTGDLVQRAEYHLQSQELIILKWSPIHLKRELDKYLWKDGKPHIPVTQLWEYFATYLYLPRLRDRNVLLEAIKAGVHSKDYFGYATGTAEDGGYLGLTFGGPPPGVYYDDSSVVVRPEVAEAQLKRQTEERAKEPQEKVVDGGLVAAQKEEKRIKEPAPASVVAPKRFYATVKLSPSRISTEAGTIGREVIQHLEGLLGAEMEVTLEIMAKSPSGFPDNVVRTVTENARTLKFEGFGFEEE